MSEAAGDIAEPEIVADAVLDGRLVLRQLRQGHRAGTDAILLAAFCSVASGDRFVDVGAGVGTVGLALARRAPGASGTLLESDVVLAALAAENARQNGLDDRVGTVVADLFDPVARRAAGRLDERASLVVSNPPFFIGTEVRISSRTTKARAHVLGVDGRDRDHAAWLRAALALLAPKGRFYMIHRPEALPRLLRGCEGRLGALVVMPVHAKPTGPAIRLLLAGLKGSRAAMRIARPFVLHGPDGRFTAEAEAVHRGETTIAPFDI